MSNGQPGSVCVMGIANCDSVRKARRWLEGKKIDHEFRDFRKTPLNATELAELLRQAGPEQLVNRRSTSWRSLCGADREIIQTALNVFDAGSSSAIKSLVELMLNNQTMIKRPVLIAGNHTLCGFNEAEWSGALCP